MFNFPPLQFIQLQVHEHMGRERWGFCICDDFSVLSNRLAITVRELFPGAGIPFHSLQQTRVLNLCKCSKPEGTDGTVFPKKRNPSFLGEKAWSHTFLQE